MRDIKTIYDPNHYHFHRVDPTPWIPIDEPEPRWYHSTVLEVFLKALAVVVFLALVCAAAYFSR